MLEVSDERLIAEAVDGSQTAFERLMGRHSSHVLRVALAVLRDSDAAQDVVQETFLVAWETLSRLRERRQFGAWVGRIAVNRAKRRLRQNRREREMTSALDGDIGESDAALCRAVRDAMEALPESQREAVRLHYFGGYAYAEIASMLDVPVSTVLGRLQRARARLRKEFPDMETTLKLDLDAALYEFVTQRARENDMSVGTFIARLLSKHQRVYELAEQKSRQPDEGHRIPVPDALDPKPAQEKVRAFFDACIRDDFKRAWEIAPYDGVRWEQTDYARTVEVVEIGEPYQTAGQRYAAGRGVFVPYEIVFEDGSRKHWRVAVRCDNAQGEWVIDGGL